jgi:feruloyl esterase
MRVLPNPRTHEQVVSGLAEGQRGGDHSGEWSTRLGVAAVLGHDRAGSRELLAVLGLQQPRNGIPGRSTSNRNLTHADAKVGAMIDQVNPDITAFRQRGGKAIVYQGWRIRP